MTAAIRAVIERLEAGETGIDADGRIWCALNGVKFQEAWESRYSRQVAFTRPPKRTREVRPGREDLPHYTTSLDAALTLVPEGADVEVYFSPREKPHRRGCVVLTIGRQVYEAHAVTPALALVIAALRARLTTETPDADPR